MRHPLSPDNDNGKGMETFASTQTATGFAF